MKAEERAAEVSCRIPGWQFRITRAIRAAEADREREVKERCAAVVESWLQRVIDNPSVAIPQLAATLRNLE